MKLNSELDIFAEIIERNGRAIMEKTVEQVLDSNYDAGKVSIAAKYHARFLERVLPVFPALVNISFEAAGGKIEKPIGIGAALTLFVEAANVHDDIIDQTIIKHRRKTTFGKFGPDISLLAGDVLLVQAAFSLYKECESLTIEQKNSIIEMTFQALVNISKSAAKESAMRRNFDVTPQDYLEVVTLRASVPAAHCTIGALLGGGSKSEISTLGDFGRNYGITGTVIDEFMDLADYQKFSARLKNECVPLPLICAMQDIAIKEKITSLLNDFEVSRGDFKTVVELVKTSDKVNALKDDILQLITTSNLQIDKNIKESIARRDISTLTKVLESLLRNINEFTSQTI